MLPVDDQEFLLGKLDELDELSRVFGVEKELQEARGAVESTRQAWSTGCHRYLWQLGEYNEIVHGTLEKIWCRHERLRSRSSSSSSSTITRAWNKIMFRRIFASRLKGMRHYRGTAGPGRPSRVLEAYRADSRVTETSIVGRDEDVENIIARIDQQVEEGDHNLRIVPVVGMPGIGKTTVARAVYAHPWAEDNFDPRIWVDAEPYFDHKRVLRRMADFLLGTNSVDDDGDEDSVHDILKEKLKEKRYLLVLDDVWNKYQSEWPALKQQLRDISGAQGTVIATTTRHCDAEMMMADNSLPPYELQALSPADCLHLFYLLLERNKIPFPEGEAEELVDKFIHEKCDGLPVAVVDLIDHFKMGFSNLRSDQVWSNLFLRRLQTYDSISLRYDLLPIYLRYCFRFCSLFPEDYNYEMEELGEIWLALRWNEAAAAALPHPEVTQYAELWKDCFFHNSEYSTDDKVTYKMHYLMHQFAIHLNDIWYEERILTCGKMRILEILGSIHGLLHLSLFVGSEMSAFLRVLSSLKTPKTLILLREPQMVLLNHKCKISRIAPDIFSKMKYLSVLDLQYTMIKRLPSTMGNLLNLRYLNLSATDITTVPRCIGKLQSLLFLKLVNCKYLRRLNNALAGLVNLQKLDIAGCHYLVHVPDGIDNMEQLRCMNIKDCSSMVQMPYGLGQCPNLHTLPRYIVGEKDGHTIQELKTLAGLEGELRIEDLQKVATGIDAETAELWKKTMLKSLTLQWQWRRHVEEENDIEAVQDVLEKLQPNKNLIKLEIISYMGKQFPSWMSGTPPYLASLEEIKLVNLKWCQALPPLGVLPRLRVAEISGMDAITKVDDAFYGAHGTFPSLQRLTFSQMLKLGKWLDVSRRNMFPHLTNLTFIHCPQMAALEMELPSVTDLILWLNNEVLYNSNGGLKGLAGSLKKLSICLCEQLLESSECVSLQELRALEEMEISGCQNLTNLPRGIRHLNFIKSLTIVCCNKLTASPNWSNDEFTSLRSLSINDCESCAQ